MSKFKTKDLLKKLNKKIDEVQSSKEFKEILKTFSKFHSYSYHNSLLILTQKPEATFVAGYKQWQKRFNRYVKKGESGIAILAPFTFKKRIEKSSKDCESGNLKEEKVVKRTYFRPVYVFDISQTEGDPLPRVDTSLEDNGAHLINPISSFLDGESIQLKYEDLSGGLKGYSKVGEIVVDVKLNDTEKAAVIIHEYAHEVLHSREERLLLSKEVKEMEAEAAAFVVMQHYDLDIKSYKYLALYKKSYDLKKSLQRINSVTSKFISYIDDYLNSKCLTNNKEE